MRYNIATGVRSVKTKSQKIIMSAMALVFPSVLLLQIGSVSAASTVVVTPTHTNGWYVADQRAGGNYAYINDPSSPYPTGALQLTTDADTASKLQYMHDTNTSLADINELSYYTKQNSGPPEAAASYQLATCLGGIVNGSCVGFTTFVYEPYWNGAVVPGGWQQWDVDQGLLWSSRSFTAGTCNIVGMPGGPPTYNLSTLKTMCPDAEAVSFGVNVGTFNLLYNVETDGVNFNGTTYNFELTNQPTDKDECKNGGWQNLTRADGSSFKNQGDCIQYVNTGK